MASAPAFSSGKAPPPPPPRAMKKPSPPPPRSRPPPPPPGLKPPPPPPKPNAARPRTATTQSTGPKAHPPKRPQSHPPPPPPPLKSPPTKRFRPNAALTIDAPIVLRDEDVFTRKAQVGEGTYGSVFVAQDNTTKEIVALKRINTKAEENGFPITALREVKILKALQHPNIVHLKEIVTSKETTHDGNSLPDKVFMVFEYLEYDLTGILDTPEIRFTAEHIKSWARQLLTGVHVMHTNNILHRDLKPANLLINKRGELKIADWGLARSWNGEKGGRLTPTVITLWYRPPELLLGSRAYSSKIDLWSVGCIIAEMFLRKGLFKGKDEAMQLSLIFKILGHPTVEQWPGLKKCPLWTKFSPEPSAVLPNRFREVMMKGAKNPKWLTDNALSMMSELLHYDPDQRASASKALDAEYFFEDPVVKEASKLSMNFAVQSIHEWDCHRKYEAAQQAIRK